MRRSTGFEGGDGRTDIVLDGQQRLTAMYYAFMAPNKPVSKRRRNRFLYFIKVDRFMDEAYDDAFIYVKGGEIMYHLGGRALRCGV